MSIRITPDIITGIATGVAIVKVARGRADHHLQRRTDLLSELGHLDLPFATPPLAPVLRCGDRAAAALSWVKGGPRRTIPGGLRAEAVRRSSTTASRSPSSGW